MTQIENRSETSIHPAYSLEQRILTDAIARVASRASMAIDELSKDTFAESKGDLPAKPLFTSIYYGDINNSYPGESSVVISSETGKIRVYQDDVDGIKCVSEESTSYIAAELLKIEKYKQTGEYNVEDIAVAPIAKLCEEVGLFTEAERKSLRVRLEADELGHVAKIRVRIVDGEGFLFYEVGDVSSVYKDSQGNGKPRWIKEVSQKEKRQVMKSQLSEAIEQFSEKLGNVESVRVGTNGDSGRVYIDFSNGEGNTQVVYDANKGWGTKVIARNGNCSMVFCKQIPGAVSIAYGASIK